MSVRMPNMLNPGPTTVGVPVEDRSDPLRDQMMNLLRAKQEEPMAEPQKALLQRLQLFQALNRPGKGPVSNIANPIIAGLLARKVGAQLDAQLQASTAAEAQANNLKLMELMSRISSQRSLTSYRGLQFDDLAAKMADSRLLTPQEKLQGERYAKKLDATPKEQADQEYKKNLLKVRVAEYNAKNKEHVDRENAINERFDLTRQDKKAALFEEKTRWNKKQEDIINEKTYKREQDDAARGFKAREVFDREERTALLGEDKEGYAQQLTSLLSMSAKIKDPEQRMEFLKSNYGPLYKEMTGKDVIFPEGEGKITAQIFNFLKSLTFTGPADRGAKKEKSPMKEPSVPTVESLLNEALEDE